MDKFVLVVCFIITAGAMCLAVFFFLKFVVALISLFVMGLRTLGYLLTRLAKQHLQKFRDTRKKN